MDKAAIEKAQRPCSNARYLTRKLGMIEATTRETAERIEKREVAALKAVNKS